jgi:hypothetical protein
MTSDGRSVERLREYLRTLKPEARAMLIVELERDLLRGHDVAGSELILQELRAAIRASGQRVPRIGNAARLFFAPLEPFLVNDAPGHMRIGRIARASLAPMWEWLGRDLIAGEIKALGADINSALFDDDRLKAEQLTRNLHERTIVRVREAVAAAADDKACRRLDVAVGTPRALETLETLAGILACRDVLASVAQRLPNNMRSFERAQIELVKALLGGAAAQKSLSATAAAKADILLYGLILVMGRLAAPWQLVRIATLAAESNDPTRVAETPFAVAVAIVLNELECMVSDLRRELKARHPVTSLLKAIHDAVYGLRTELDLSADSPWSRQFTAARSEVAALLNAEIESVPSRVRRLLRPRALKDIPSGSLPDAGEANEVEMLVELVGVCRKNADEFAVSEAAGRSYDDAQRYLESGTKVMLDSLRHAGEADRPFRQAQVEAAIRLSRIVFGADYAGLLAKAAEIAARPAAFAPEPLRA